MKILVTGGTGFIGSHTVVELQNAGFEVVIVDNLSKSHHWIVDSIAEITGIKPGFCQLDLEDKDVTKQFFSENQDIEGVIHFAAYKAVGESVEEPLLYYHNNLVSLINLLESIIQYQIDHLVFSSSCTVYGQPGTLPVSENSPIKKAFAPYGNTKQISEEIISETFNKKGFNAISLRYFNPIGAHDSAKIGELPIGVPDNLIPFVTQTAIGKREQLKVFGDDYNTPDGSAIRDYIHVVDLAKAHVIAVKRLLEKKNKSNYEVFNLGTGKGYSVLEVIRAFEKSTGKKLNYKIVGRRPGDVEKVWADTAYANEELGWKAEKSLEEMVKSAWEWEKKLKDKKI